jgi:antitoxin HicB
MQFSYPVKFTADQLDGGFVVTCRDLPEAISQGESLVEAMKQAEGAIQAALEGRLHDRLDIPNPSDLKRGERLVPVPVSTAMKAAVYLAMREQQVNTSQLAKRLGIDEKAARRLLDPSHASKVPALEAALQVLGRRASVVIG